MSPRKQRITQKIIQDITLLGVVGSVFDAAGNVIALPFEILGETFKFIF